MVAWTYDLLSVATRYMAVCVRVRVGVAMCRCSGAGVGTTSGAAAIFCSKLRLVARVTAQVRMALAATRMAATEQA